MIMNIKKAIINTLLLVIAITTILSVRTNADVINYGVSPSTISQVIIEQGQSKVFKLKVGNKSSEDISLDIEMYPSIENEEDLSHINIDDMVFLDRYKTTIGKDKVSEVLVKLIIPEELPKGEYRLFINFTRKPLASENQDNISNIKVPINLFVGTISDYENLKESYKLLDSYLALDNESIDDVNQRTKIGHALGYLKELAFELNPINVIDTFKTVKNKPYYAVNENDNVYYDINQNIEVPLIDVLSKNENNINNWRYIHIEDSLMNETIKSVEFYKNTLIINTENKKTELILSETIINGIKLQWESETFEKENISLSSFVNKIYVPVNRTYSNQLRYNLQIENDGDKPLFIDGAFTLSDKKGQALVEKTYSQTLIKKATTSNLVSDIPITTFKEDGFYQIKSDIAINKNKEIINYDINVKEYRSSIFLITLIAYIGYLIFLILIIVLIIKGIRKCREYKILKTIREKIKEIEDDELSEKDIELLINEIELLLDKVKSNKKKHEVELYLAKRTK